MRGYPDIKAAILLWQESVAGCCEWSSDQWKKDYIFHSSNIALSAEIIAKHCGMNADKAYVLGLLHDWGKIHRHTKQKGHIRIGYDKMMAEGWPEAARICLTHSFPDRDFDFKDYTSYPSEELKWAKKLISQIEYDDYDRLIQLCDILHEGCLMVSFEKRLQAIRDRYHLTHEQTRRLEEGAVRNKAYFDQKCGCDIYKLLKIGE